MKGSAPWRWCAPRWTILMPSPQVGARGGRLSPSNVTSSSLNWLQNDVHSRNFPSRTPHIPTYRPPISDVSCVGILKHLPFNSPPNINFLPSHPRIGKLTGFRTLDRRKPLDSDLSRGVRALHTTSRRRHGTGTGHSSSSLPESSHLLKNKASDGAAEKSSTGATAPSARIKGAASLRAPKKSWIDYHACLTCTGPPRRNY